MAPKHVAMTALAVLLSLTVSGCLSAPAKAPSTIGFVYASGGSLMVDGSAVQLFGPNDQYVFINAMIASGLWGTPDPNAWGNNGLFPSGPDGHIDGITDADSLWHEYFRYFLHYQAVGSPRPNMVRVWIADDTWYPNGVYDAWKSDPATFWAIFDRMVYWAHQAGVYVVPVLGHFATQKDNTFFDTSSPEYLKHVEATKAILARYDGDSTIAMWDLWNEPDVDNDVYWASVGGITALKAWANALISDVRPSAPTHPLTLGFGGWTLFPGLPTDYGLAYWLFYYGGLDVDVTSHHSYGTAEDQYLIDDQTSWIATLGKPHFESETGYNEWPGPSPIGYGYWPWYVDRALAAGWAGVGTMVFLDNGRGVYADYPYSGPLPDYPSDGGGGAGDSSGNATAGPDVASPIRITNLTVIAHGANWAALQWTAPGDDGTAGLATWYDFRYAQFAITSDNFDAADHYELPFFPHTAGQGEGAMVVGLSSGVIYWFALKTSDEVPNWSDASNSPSVTTE